MKCFTISFTYIIVYCYSVIQARRQYLVARNDQQRRDRHCYNCDLSDDSKGLFHVPEKACQPLGKKCFYLMCFIQLVLLECMTL